MPSSRQELATAVLGGKVYVLGGYDDNGTPTTTVEAYNPATNSWNEVQPLPFPNNHNAAAVAVGQLFAFGGISNQAFVYDAETDSWKPIASMNFPHGSTPAVGVINDKIYVAGGNGLGMTQRELEVYDPAANTWTVLAPMNVPRNHCAGGVIGGKLYVAGGRDSPDAPSALEAYDPQANSWTPLASMPTPRSGIAAAVLNGEIYAFGGEIPTLHGEVEAYNPANNTWRKLANMPQPRHGIWASVIGRNIYIPGGAVEQGFASSNLNTVFTLAARGAFANISTRGEVQPGDNALIGGFIVSGARGKRVLCRALGPSLPVANTLADPQLELRDKSGALTVANNNWREAANRQEIADTAVPPQSDNEAASVALLAPGEHTAIVRGSGNSSGIALIEIYDLESAPDSELANISTRGLVQPGDGALIGGVIVAGTDSRHVLLRAIGPSLPVSGALPDPRLELRDVNGSLLAENDDWRSAQEAEVSATGIPPSNERESAIVATLAPGNYTAILRDAHGATGVALVEAYAL